MGDDVRKTMNFMGLSVKLNYDLNTMKYKKQIFNQ